MIDPNWTFLYVKSTDHKYLYSNPAALYRYHDLFSHQETSRVTRSPFLSLPSLSSSLSLSCCQSQCPPPHVFGKFTYSLNKTNLPQALSLFNCADTYRLTLMQYIQVSGLFSDIPYSYHKATYSPVTLLVFFANSKTDWSILPRKHTV